MQTTIDTTQEIINQQVSIIEKSATVFQSAPQILIANKERTEKAITVGKNILASIREHGMTPELDTRAMSYLANISKAVKEMKEGRSEVTQIMDALKKMYTEIESQLDGKKTGSIPALIQSERDAYVKKCAEEKARKEKEAADAEAKAKEAIDIKFHMINEYRSQFAEYISGKKQKLAASFNAITLNDFTEKEEKLNALKFTWSFEVASPNWPDYIKYNNVEEIKAISKAAITEAEKGIYEQYMSEMSTFKTELIDKLPSKKSELIESKRLADEQQKLKAEQEAAELKRQEEISKANAAQKKKLEAQAVIDRDNEAKRNEEIRLQQEKSAADQKERELAEAKKLEEETAAAKLKAEQEAEISKQGEHTMAMFEKEAAISEFNESPDTRQGYDLIVLHAAAYVQIFQFWFEAEGKNLPMDKMGNTKLDQMKGYCEKVAHKSGTMIDSKFMKYEPTFKAINKKS